MYPRLPAVIAVACLLSLLIGCSKSSTQSLSHASASDFDDHLQTQEHTTKDDHPESYGEAVASVAAMRDTIRDAFEAKDEETAHDSLHEVGHLLDHLTELAESQLPSSVSTAVKSEAAALFELFGKVDDKMHGAEGADYADVADEIDAGIDRLHKYLPSQESQEAPSETRSP